MIVAYKIWLNPIEPISGGVGGPTRLKIFWTALSFYQTFVSEIYPTCEVSKEPQKLTPFSFILA